MKNLISRGVSVLQAVFAIGIVTIVGLSTTCFAENTMMDLGTLGGGTYSYGYDTSSNGSVIVGYSHISGGERHAFKYAGGIMTDLGTLVGGNSWASSVSSDGSVIVGDSDIAGGGYHAFKYVGSTMIDMGTLGGANSSAFRVSSDGSVIIGYSDIAGNIYEHAFKYVGNTMTDLGTLGGTFSDAYGVSSDGSVIVGRADTSAGYGHAFKYAGSTMIDLGTLGGTNSIARGVSSDGSVIVGNSDIMGNTGSHAFKYVGNMMTDLGTLGGTDSNARSVSSDGSVIVGNSDIMGNTGSHAFKYVGSTMTDLGTLGGTNSYAQYVSSNGSVIVGGAEITGNIGFHAFKYTGSTMTDLGTLGGTESIVRGVSSDGSVIVGYAQTTGGDEHAFVYRNRMIDVNNTYSVLSVNGNQLYSLFNLQNSLLSNALNYDCPVFGQHNIGVAIGGRYTNISDPASSAGAANFRIAYRFNKNIKAGILIDQTFANSTPNNFKLQNSAPLIGVFGAWSQNENGLGPELKVSLVNNSLNTKITRSTLPFTEAGAGKASLESQGAQLEGSWGYKLGNTWKCLPFVGFRTVRVTRSGYTETNVDFPITFNSLDQSFTTGYMGVKASGIVLPKLAINASVGIEKDFSNSIDGYSGSINTLGSFALAAPSIERTRGFASVGADYLINKTQNVGFSMAYNHEPLSNANAFACSMSYAVGF